MYMAVAYWFLGRDKCTTWPSSKSRKSFQAIIYALHLISFRQVNSYLSSPTKAYRPVAGLTNSLNISSIGSSRNGLPQFVYQLLEYLYFSVCLFGWLFVVHQQRRTVCFVLWYFFCTPQGLFLTIGCTFPSSMITDDRHPVTIFASYSFWSSLRLPSCCYQVSKAFGHLFKIKAWRSFSPFHSFAMQAAQVPTLF